VCSDGVATVVGNLRDISKVYTMLISYARSNPGAVIASTIHVYASATGVELDPEKNFALKHPPEIYL